MDPHPDERALPRLRVLGHAGHGKATLAAAIGSVLGAGDPGPPAGAARGRPARPGPGAGTLEPAKPQPVIELAVDGRRWLLHTQPAEDEVRLLLTGRAQLDGAILAVSAADGPTPQTREQVLLARKVGIPALVVALTMTDLVDDEDLLAVVEQEVRELLAEHGFGEWQVPVVRVSAEGALAGDPSWTAGIVELMTACGRWIPVPAPADQRPFLLPVEEAFEVAGRGTVVTGRVEQGVVSVGDEVEFVGACPDRARRIVASVGRRDRRLDQARPGDAVGVLLRGPGDGAPDEGQALAEPGSVALQPELRAQVYVLSPDEGGRDALCDGGDYDVLTWWGALIPGTVQLGAVQLALPGERLEVRLRLGQPVVARPGLRVAIRQRNRMVALGRIVNAAV
ncbi:MAG TPA: GTP-binding protein [Actinomycetes bacterium]|nr:GTP-binding protein [Actinomycetes bacterium]